MIKRVTVARLFCEHADDDTSCSSLMYADAELDDEEVRAAARERGWEADERDRCPRHRSDPEEEKS